MSYSNYTQIESAIREGNNFTGNSSRGEFCSISGQYKIYSYNTLIAYYVPYVRAGYSMNTRKYSQTTSRLQNIIKRALADMPNLGEVN